MLSKQENEKKILEKLKDAASLVRDYRTSDLFKALEEHPKRSGSSKLESDAETQTRKRSRFFGSRYIGNEASQAIAQVTEGCDDMDGLSNGVIEWKNMAERIPTEPWSGRLFGEKPISLVSHPWRYADRLSKLSAEINVLNYPFEYFMRYRPFDQQDVDLVMYSMLKQEDKPILSQKTFHKACDKLVGGKLKYSQVPKVYKIMYDRALAIDAEMSKCKTNAQLEKRQFWMQLTDVGDSSGFSDQEALDLERFLVDHYTWNNADNGSWKSRSDKTAASPLHIVAEFNRTQQQLKKDQVVAVQEAGVIASDRQHEADNSSDSEDQDSGDDKHAGVHDRDESLLRQAVEAKAASDETSSQVALSGNSGVGSPMSVMDKLAEDAFGEPEELSWNVEPGGKYNGSTNFRKHFTELNCNIVVGPEVSGTDPSR